MVYIELTERHGTQKCESVDDIFGTVGEKIRVSNASFRTDEGRRETAREED